LAPVPLPYAVRPRYDLGAMDRLARFSWGVLGYNLIVILWGALVRATGSGAGCGNHWPLCNGEVVPRSPGVETLIEFSHRATSGLALLAVVALLAWTFRARPSGHRARRAAVAAMVFMLLEAGVGAGLVLLNLVADNISLARGVWMAGHLVNTLLLVAALTLTAHFLSGGPSWRLEGRRGLAVALGAGLLGILLVSASGAVTALGDTLFPAESLRAGFEADLSPTAHLLVRLRMIHPFVAAVVSIYLLLLASQPGFTRGASRRLALAVALLTLLQMGIGIVNILLLAPVWLQLVHLLVTNLLWIALVRLTLASLAARDLARPAAETVEPSPV